MYKATCYGLVEPSSGLYHRTDPNLISYNWDSKSLQYWSILPTVYS